MSAVDPAAPRQQYRAAVFGRISDDRNDHGRDGKRHPQAGRNCCTEHERGKRDGDLGHRVAARHVDAVLRRERLRPLPRDGPGGDSALVVSDGTARLVNQNDCRTDDLDALRAHGPVDLHWLQYSGAIWYPMVYEEPPERLRELVDAKVASQFARAMRYVEALGARTAVAVELLERIEQSRKLDTTLSFAARVSAAMAGAYTTGLPRSIARSTCAARSSAPALSSGASWPSRTARASASTAGNPLFLDVTVVNGQIFIFSAEDTSGLRVYEFQPPNVLLAVPSPITDRIKRVEVRGPQPFPALFVHRSNADATSDIDIYDTKWLTQGGSPLRAKSIPHAGAKDAQYLHDTLSFLFPDRSVEENIFATVLPIAPLAFAVDSTWIASYHLVTGALLFIFAMRKGCIKVR